MKKILLLSMCLTGLFTSMVYGDVTVPPERLLKVKMSATDVNRIICGAEVKDVVYSKEKGLIVKVSGKSVFLKFQVLEKEGKLAYGKTPAELYVTCGGNVYSMVAEPSNVPPVTIRLADRKDRLKANAALFKGLALEEKIATFIRFAYTDDIPETFDVIKSPSAPKEMAQEEKFPSIDMRLRRTVRAEGEGLTLKEYFISPRKDVEVREIDFMSLVENPAAVALESTVMKKGGRYRLFVVGYSVPHGQGGMQ